MEAAQSVEWIVASGEVDALMLEYNLIQRHRPRFNIRYRDDKSYPYLALTVGETWPRAQVMRGAKRKNVRYFGPYGHAWAIRDTLDALTRVFPVRTCTNSFFDSARPGEAPVPVLRHRPVLRAVRAGGHRGHRGVLPGGRRRAGRLPGRQHEAGPRAAGRARCGRPPSARSTSRPPSSATSSRAARRAMESQEMVLTQPEDLDVIGLAEDDLEAAFQVFFVRGGRVLGRAGWVVDRVEDLNRAELVASFVRQLYMERTEVPPRVLVPAAAGGRAR